MLENDIQPHLIGMDVAYIDKIYDFMEWHIHYVGRGGISSFTMSAVDIAFWDIKGKREQQPHWKRAEV